MAVIDHALVLGANSTDASYYLPKDLLAAILEQQSTAAKQAVEAFLDRNPKLQFDAEKRTFLVQGESGVMPLEADKEPPEVNAFLSTVISYIASAEVTPPEVGVLSASEEEEEQLLPTVEEWRVIEQNDVYTKKEAKKKVRTFLHTHPYLTVRTPVGLEMTIDTSTKNSRGSIIAMVLHYIDMYDDGDQFSWDISRTEEGETCLELRVFTLSVEVSIGILRTPSYIHTETPVDNGFTFLSLTLDTYEQVIQHEIETIDSFTDLKKMATYTTEILRKRIESALRQTLTEDLTFEEKVQQITTAADGVRETIQYMHEEAAAGKRSLSLVLAEQWNIPQNYITRGKIKSFELLSLFEKQMASVFESVKSALLMNQLDNVLLTRTRQRGQSENVDLLRFNGIKFTMPEEGSVPALFRDVFKMDLSSLVPATTEAIQDIVEAYAGIRNVDISFEKLLGILKKIERLEAFAYNRYLQLEMKDKGVENVRATLESLVEMVDIPEEKRKDIIGFLASSSWKDLEGVFKHVAEKLKDKKELLYILDPRSVFNLQSGARALLVDDEQIRTSDIEAFLGSEACTSDIDHLIATLIQAKLMNDTRNLKMLIKEIRKKIVIHKKNGYAAEQLVFLNLNDARKANKDIMNAFPDDISLYHTVAKACAVICNMILHNPDSLETVCQIAGKSIHATDKPKGLVPSVDPQKALISRLLSVPEEEIDTLVAQIQISPYMHPPLQIPPNMS